MMSLGPKPTQMPLDYPDCYPNHLKLQTTVVIGEALKRFSEQKVTLQLCKCVLSELTPHFRLAVRQKLLRADLAQFAMGALLHYIALANCDDDSERFRLEQEIRKSDEWLEFAKQLIKPSKTPSKSNSNIELAIRRTIVHENPDVPSEGICTFFDNKNVPLPKSMKEAGSWARAYKSTTHRPAIQSLISRDRIKTPK